MSENISIEWYWADVKIHPAIRYPRVWVSGTTDTESATIFGMFKSFNPRIVTPKDVINSINDYNQGMVSKPPEYYVDITCNPYGEAYNLLLAAQNGDRYFDVILLPLADQINEDAKEVGQPDGAWGPEKEVFIGCKVLNLNERYAMGAEPTVTFACRALRFALQDLEFGNGTKGRTYTKAQIPGL